MVAAEAPACCPRCRGELVRNHHELVCLVHGQVWEEPRRVVDIVGDAEADEAPLPGRVRRYAASQTGRSVYYGVSPTDADSVSLRGRVEWAKNLRELGRSLDYIARTTRLPVAVLAELFDVALPASWALPTARENRLIAEKRELVFLAAVEELRAALGDSKTFIAVYLRWGRRFSREQLMQAMAQAKAPVAVAS